ncbi:Serine/threonine protein kinase with similarity to casein kinase I [Trichoderma simmonsii]|uniref:non-specific serine/threonine protein kinase n=1 Tax=Trichoderma simmonsii TaxID=1491479 RepID=A0A8G0L0S2_9HYPO|nr:Serine/threonine protein kinase with similarity to casein kinase I [Trichoderma simmonsii]
MSEIIQAFKKHVINNRWRLDGLIGQGGFGSVYIATDLQTNQIVAVKLQNLPPGSTSSPSQMDNLESESFYYTLLRNNPGIATHHENGRQEKVGRQAAHEFMVYELLGPSLQTLFYRCGKKFSLKTTLMLADQLLERLELFDSHKIVHRDIKPDNFVMGFGKENGKMVYILDLGLVGEYTKDEEVVVAPSYAFCGTYYWAPIAAHLNRSQSPKDDLESLAYMLIYFASGSLPWQGCAKENDNDDTLSERVTRFKLGLPIKDICKGLPSPFARHLMYARSSRYNHKPKYAELRAMYRRLMKRLGYKYDGVYDWDLLEDGGNNSMQHGPELTLVHGSVQQYKELSVDSELTLVNDSLPMKKMKDEDEDYKLPAKKVRGRPKRAGPRAKKVKEEQKAQEEEIKQQNEEPAKPLRKPRIIFIKKKKSESPPPRTRRIKVAQVEKKPKKEKKEKVVAKKTAANKAAIKVVVKKVPTKKPRART